MADDLRAEHQLDRSPKVSSPN